MPTAAKLIAGLGFLLLSYLAAEVSKPYLPEGTQFGFYSYVSAVIGGLTGWIVMGGLVGEGIVRGAGYGVRVSFTVVFWALLVFSIYEMVIRATKLRYDGPMEALTAVFSIALEYGGVLLAPAVLAVLILGGALIGTVTEWAARRWS